MKFARLRVLTCAVMVAGGVLAPGTPANAAITGTVDFVCTASLPVFPTTPPVMGNCGFVGPVPGTAVVSASGTDNRGHAFVVGGTGPFRAQFFYSDPCPVPAPVIPPLGVASGVAWVTGLTAVDNGVVVGARFDTDFEWQRVGGNAVFTTSNTRFTFTNGDVAFATLNDAGTATFAPLPPAGNCGGPAPTLAVVAGTDHIVL